jgi:hypothetical protein
MQDLNLLKDLSNLGLNQDGKINLLESNYKK